MPVICSHCHQMVAEQQNCPNCGKRMAVQAAGDDAPAEIDRAAMVSLMRYALAWMLGIVGVGVLCVLGIYILLL